jgi:hypothetical protein
VQLLERLALAVERRRRYLQAAEMVDPPVLSA